MRSLLLAAAIAATATACNPQLSSVNLICYNPTSGVRTVDYREVSKANYNHTSRSWVMEYAKSDDAERDVIIYQQAPGESCATYMEK